MIFCRMDNDVVLSFFIRVKFRPLKDEQYKTFCFGTYSDGDANLLYSFGEVGRVIIRYVV